MHVLPSRQSTDNPSSEEDTSAIGESRPGTTYLCALWISHEWQQGNAPDGAIAVGSIGALDKKAI